MDNTINAAAAKPAQLFDAGPIQSTIEQQIAFDVKQSLPFLGTYIGSILHSPIVTESMKNHSEIDASEINAGAKPTSLIGTKFHQILTDIQLRLEEKKNSPVYDPTEDPTDPGSYPVDQPSGTWTKTLEDIQKELNAVDQQFDQRSVVRA